MACRATFVTDEFVCELSPEFYKEWNRAYHFGEDNQAPIASKFERKSHREIMESLGRELQKKYPGGEIYAAQVWEDGRIERFIITQSEIIQEEIAKAY